MAQFYRLIDRPDDPIWVYSERGVLNYTFCAMPVQTQQKLLTEAVNGVGQTLLQLTGTPSSQRLLTEFELGNNGFGTPDNGLFIRSEHTNTFVFIEGKCIPLTASWSEPPKLTQEQSQPLSDNELYGRCRQNTFNSTINGQLELRWRFVNAFRKAKAIGQKLVTESFSPPPLELMENDRFYWRLRMAPQHETQGHWRRVEMSELGPLWDMFGEVNQFFVMAITDDEERPTKLDSLRLFDENQQLIANTRKVVFWLSFRKLASMLDKVEGSTERDKKTPAAKEQDQDAK
jgi:hypothetical protein